MKTQTARLQLNRHATLLRGLQPEAELVLACALPSAAKGEWIRALVQRGLNWSRVLEIALEQYVLPLVTANLATADLPELPAAWTKDALQHFDRNARRNLYLTTQLVGILDSFQSLEIVAIPYKGPTLAALAYGDLALRTFDDLDFLVPHRHLALAYQQLHSLGFEAEIQRETALARGGAPGQYLFRSADSQCVVEIHTERTLRYYPTPLDLEALLSRTIQLPLAGRSVRSFAPEDLVMILSVHASKHLWGRLLWICDLAELVCRTKSFQWEAAFERAHRAGCGRMVSLGLYLANGFLHAPLPSELAKRLCKVPHIEALGREVAASVFTGPKSVPSLARRFRFRVRTSESIGAGLRHSLRLLTSPNEKDRNWARWSRGPLAPLQRALRPLRLLRKYGV